MQFTIGNGGEDWRAHFDLADPNGLAASAFDADPDGDGLKNLFEYFTDESPLTPGLSRVPAGEVVDDGGIDYLALRFVMDKSVADVTARVEATSDLGATIWTRISPADRRTTNRRLD